MKVRDWHIICRTLGGQLSLEVGLGVWAAAIYFLADAFFNLTPFWMAIIKGIAGFLAVYYFVYSIILTKKIVDKYFK